MNIPTYGVLEGALILGKHYNPEMWRPRIPNPALLLRLVRFELRLLHFQINPIRIAAVLPSNAGKPLYFDQSVRSYATSKDCIDPRSIQIISTAQGKDLAAHHRPTR